MNYQEREKHFRRIAEQLKKKYNWLSAGRLLFFVMAIGIAIFLTQWHWSLALIWALLALVLFLRIVVLHRNLQAAEIHQSCLAEVNRQEQAALEYHFAEFANGLPYKDPLHPYTHDLDIFGNYSLFQFCNRTTTVVGSHCLANWLKQAAEPSVVAARQQAVKELGAQLDWRHHFRAYGLEEVDQEEHQRGLQKWMSEPSFVLPKKGIRWALWLFPIWAVLGMVWVIPNHPLAWLALVFLPSAVLLQQNLKRVNRTLAFTSKAEAWLQRYALLIQQIEKLEVQSELLQSLKNNFSQAEASSTSQAIQRLSYCLSQLNVRNNIFALPLNLITVWDLQWVYQLEKWKAQHQENLPRWFVALGEFDALSSLANLHYNHPDWVFPNLHQEDFLSTTQLGHPLIPKEKRVGNNLQMPTQQHLKLMTGSNMAGKSTWLRTLGVNIVLAQAGAPVCAQSLDMPSLLIFTGMRTQDDLSASASSFYAELYRLRAMLDVVIAQEGKRPSVFFLLDEILKGTNSRDRHHGSRALILQLMHYSSAGFIATHDLDLTAMEAEYRHMIQNVCMEVAIREEELYFDYQLKPGVSQSFNASLLMQKMGIGMKE